MPSMTKEFASGLLNSALFIAIATALISVWGVLYQESYYNYFGINPNLAGIELDTVTLANGGIVSGISTLIIVAIFGLTFLYQSGLKKNRIITKLIRDIILYVLGIAILVVAAVIRQPTSISDYVTLAGGALVLSLQIYISIIKKYLFYKDNKTQLRFNDLIERYNQSHKPKDESKIWVPKYLLFIVGGIFFILITSSAVQQVAFTHASTRNSFTILNRSSMRIQQIVVARSRDGLIVKDYDMKFDTFHPGYKVLKLNDNQTFEVATLR